MAAQDTETLELTTREEHGSRSVRRLRRTGRVPGIIYGGGDAPLSFDADARLLRNTLAHTGSILQVKVDGGDPQPVLIKDVQRHPVRGDILHADLLRVRMDVAIQTPVPVHVENSEKAPGIVAGGVLSQEIREVNIEALPGDVPEFLVFDASGMDINETALLSQITPPPGVTFVDDPEEIVIASITPPTQEPTEEEIETETAVVGEEGAAEAAKAEGATGDEAATGD